MRKVLGRHLETPRHDWDPDHPRRRTVPPSVVLLRVFVWGHVMGVTIYLAHGAIWLAAAGWLLFTGRPTPEPWLTLRIDDPIVLGMWVLVILTLCMLLAGYREQLGLDK
jgi:hypothetical protein